MHKAGDEGRFLLFIVVRPIVAAALVAMAILHLVVTCRIIAENFFQRFPEKNCYNFFGIIYRLG